MIRESLYFSFNNRKSTDFPIVNINVGSGLYEESIVSSKSIMERYPRNAFKPYFFGTQRQVKEFQLSFTFLEPWNDDMIDDIVRWLNVDDYKPLFFEANIDRVFYVMPVDDITLIHNGLKEGYLRLNVRCDSAYSYSHEITTPWYDFTKTNTIQIANRGHFEILPELWIEKVGEGDITIQNMTNGNQTTLLKSIDTGEKLHINGMDEIIETNKKDVHRYDNFNDVYLELVYGNNIIKASSNILLKLKYQYVFS